MLKPIPSKILTHSATLLLCTGVDAWQNPKYQEIQLQHICVQPTHETRMDANNTEQSLNSIAFVDARLSSPAGYDFQTAQDQSEANGQPLALMYNGRHYIVLTIDTLCDDTGVYHHTELGLK